MNIYLEKIASLSGSVKRGLVTLRQASGVKTTKMFNKLKKDTERLKGTSDSLKQHLTPESKAKGRINPKEWMRDATRKQDMGNSAYARFNASSAAYEKAYKNSKAAMPKVESIAKKVAIGAGVGTAGVVGGVIAAKKMKKEASYMNIYLEKIASLAGLAGRAKVIGRRLTGSNAYKMQAKMHINRAMGNEKGVDAAYKGYENARDKANAAKQVLRTSTKAVGSVAALGTAGAVGYAAGSKK